MLPLPVVAKAADFAKAPMGGCMLKCDSRLPCGHACTLKYAADSSTGLARTTHSVVVVGGGATAVIRMTRCMKRSSAIASAPKNGSVSTPVR